MNDVTIRTAQWNMNANGPVATVDPAAIARLLASAADVRRRHHFFGWVQACLFGLLPRAVLICGSYSRARRELVFDVFNTIVLGDALSNDLVESPSRLLSRCVTAWLAGGSRAMQLDVRSVVESPEVLAELGRLQIDWVMVHGVSRPQRPDELETFFLLADPLWSSRAQDLACLEMLLPCLHMTYLRMLKVEQAVDAKPVATTLVAPRRVATLLTRREMQVLSFVREGLRNAAIGEALGISGLTAKNHVQSILRKLGASSRAHAIARADALGVPRVPARPFPSVQHLGDSPQSSPLEDGPLDEIN